MFFRAALQYHKRHRNVAVRGGLSGQHHHITDSRILANHRLDILRVDVHAVKDKHVIDPTADMDAPLTVQIAGIARVKPAIFKSGCRQVRLTQIAAKHAVAAHRQLAPLTRCQRLALRRHRANIDAGQWSANTVACAFIVGVSEGNGSGFRGTVAGLQARGDVFPQLLTQRWGDMGTAQFKSKPCQTPAIGLRQQLLRLKGGNMQHIDLKRQTTLDQLLASRSRKNIGGTNRDAIEAMTLGKVVFNRCQTGKALLRRTNMTMRLGNQVPILVQDQFGLAACTRG